MKELSIKEKAQRYDEAIKYAHYLINERCKEGTNDSFHRADLDKMFPKLAESEDERIKNEIIQFLLLPHPQFVGKRDHEEWIAWLKKQGGHSAKFANYKEAVMDIVYNYVMPDEIDDELRRIGKGEQKPAWNKEVEIMLETLMKKNMRIILKNMNRFSRPTKNGK